MTITTTPVPESPSPSTSAWTRLTEQDATRIATAIEATHAPSTRTVYDYSWRIWERWCTGRGLAPMPADPAAICAYLTERADEGVVLGTLDQACAAIAYQHARRGLANPIEDQTLRRVRRGLRRILGAGPRRPTRPLSVTEVQQIVAGIDRHTPPGARDAALILLGFAGALRRSELAALTLADLEPKPGGLLVHLRGSKTDPDRRGQVVGVAHGRHPATDPIAALDDWLAVRGTAPGPLYTSMRRGTAPLHPLGSEGVARVVKNRAITAGLSAERITTHSLRAGHATSAAQAGISVERIAAQTRHRRIDVLIERYIRPVHALQTTSSRDLGL